MFATDFFGNIKEKNCHKNTLFRDIFLILILDLLKCAKTKTYKFVFQKLYLSALWNFKELNDNRISTLTSWWRLLNQLNKLLFSGSPYSFYPLLKVLTCTLDDLQNKKNHQFYQSNMVGN